MVSGGAVIGFVKDESVSSYTPKPASCPHDFLPLKTLPHWFFHVLSRRFAPSLMAFVAESVSFCFSLQVSVSDLRAHFLFWVRLGAEKAQENEWELGILFFFLFTVVARVGSV